MNALFLLTALSVQAQQRNTHFSHTLDTSASAETIWQIWTDVPAWKDWDNGLQSAELFGPFQQGTAGILIPDKGLKSRFIIDSLESGRSYTFKTKLPIGALYVKRYLTVQDGKTRFTHEVWFTGLAKGLFGSVLGKNYRKIMPDVMQKIAALAEAR